MKKHPSTPHITSHSSLFSRFLTLALYSLPVIFFIICYYLIISSGEDIFQGASTTPAIFSDALAAFRHSARLADMYAWSVINFFDYYFQFGIDTLFRLVDVAAAFAVFYLATALALQRRPRLTLPDAVTFAALFLIVMLTPHGYILYAGFSAIHNYLFIAFFSILYIGLLLRALLGKPFPIQSLPISVISMLCLGFIFGFASNTTAIIFLLTFALFLLWKKLTRQSQKLPSWFIASLVGIALAFVLIYFIGPGLSDYTSSAPYLSSFDYLPFSEIFAHPLASVPKILKHLVLNFGRFFAPLLAVSALILLYALAASRRSVRSLITTLRATFTSLTSTPSERDYLVASLIFIIMHILAFTQLRCPTRLFLPAYLLATALLLLFARRFFSELHSPQRRATRHLFTFSTLLLLPLITLLSIRLVFALEYRSRILSILQEIKNSDSAELCFTTATTAPRQLPFIYLGQDPFLVEWATPETIYGKAVYLCD